MVLIEIDRGKICNINFVKNNLKVDDYQRGIYIPTVGGVGIASSGDRDEEEKRKKRKRKDGYEQHY